MSYDICKSVSIKNGTITLNVASNNVYPQVYQNITFCEGMPFEKAKFFFFHCAIDGDIQFKPNKSTLPYEHALMRVKQWFSDNVQSEFEYYMKARDLDDRGMMELYKEPYRVWNEALAEKDTECVLRFTGYQSKGNDILIKAPKQNKYGYFTKFGFTQRIEEAKMSRKKAELFVYSYNDMDYECRTIGGHKVYVDEAPNC